MYIHMKINKTRGEKIMKFSLKKLAALGVSVIMAMSMSMSAFAANVGLSLTVKKTWVESTFTYHSPGNVLKVRIDYNEKHRTTGQSWTGYIQDVKTGSYTTVTAYARPDEGYDFIDAFSSAYVNEILYMKSNTEIAD